MSPVSDRWASLVTRSAFAMAGRGQALSILVLHRVRTQRDEIFPEEMDADRFDRLMGHLARSHAVLPLGQAFAALRAGKLPPRAVTITFDDGYADNAEVALPILQRHGLTATFFVSTGFLDGGMMWNDHVVECIRRCRSPMLDLGVFGGARMALDGTAARRAAVSALIPKFMYMDLAAREDALARLTELCAPQGLPRDLMLRSQQVKALAEAGMELGAHTVHHPILAREAPAVARREIADGRDALRALTGEPVDVFAYPNGRPGTDFRSEHVQMLRDCGFRCAVTTAAGIATASDDAHQLPRYTPWDRSPWRWSLRLLAARRLAPPGLQAGA